MSDVTGPVLFNPFEPGFAENPYPQYERLRDEEPVHQTPFGVWTVFRYEDVQRFLRDHTLSVEDRNAHPTSLTEMVQEFLGAEEQRFSTSMLDRDPPDHTRLRRLVSKAFTPRQIEALRPRIAQLVGEAIGAARASGGMELVGDLAFPLPFRVISEMLGMPDTDTDQLREWSGLLVRTLEPVADPAILGAIRQAADEMYAHIGEVIAWKRSHMADDMLSALVAAEENGDVLSDEELADQVTLIYIAGHETTVNLIGNGTLALLQHPDQIERIREDPTLVPKAVEELLRYDSPVQMSRRITLEPVEVRGATIEPGAFAVLVLASANRDPRQWGEDADVVDVTRAGAERHVSFGGGHHLCLGAALARLEARETFAALFAGDVTPELAGEPEWNGRLNLRGVGRLELSLG
ncbi:MAG: cytochrome P450 [Acidimicrobiales bacterium]